MTRKAKIGLVLGGGGARGLAHIGVLKALEREGIPLNWIVGTSMGALVGAAYAMEPNALALEKKVTDFLAGERNRSTCLKRLEKLRPFTSEKLDLLHRMLRIAEKHLFLGLAILKKALVSEQDMHDLLAVFLPDVDIKDTVIPFAASTVDLISGKEVILDRGSLIHAVMASCAVPGFMPPVARDGMLLVDGGVLDPVPVAPAKAAGAEVVIGVDAGCCLCRVPPIEDGIDVINRATEVMSYCLNCRSGENADVLIRPDVKLIPWTEFTQYTELIRQGEVATEQKIPEIKEKTAPKSLAKIFPFSFRSVPWWRKTSAHAR